jgi:hypothetical protein
MKGNFRSVLYSAVKMYIYIMSVTVCTDGGRVVIGLDSKNWFSFEMSVNLGDLLRCGRRGVETVISGGLTGRLGSLSPSQRAFLTSLNSFLIANTSLTES